MPQGAQSFVVFGGLNGRLRGIGFPSLLAPIAKKLVCPNLSMAWRTEMRAHPARRDGHVEAVPQRRQHVRPAGRDLVRPVPCHPLGRSPRQGAKSEYARLSGKDRRFIKGQKYRLLSRKENLTLEGRQALRTLLRANKRTKPGRGASSTTGGRRSSGRG
jgi:hypothetical protein